MEDLLLEEIVKAIRGKSTSVNNDVKAKGISTDSRNIRKGDLFFAIKGARFDGHAFVPLAMKEGAVGAVISCQIPSDEGHRNFPIIHVADTVTALGDLAKYYRQKLKTKVIGITGSNGKTTTKEMIHHLLSHFSSVAKSQKSFNNCIGVPLTIFEIEHEHQYAVVEMGTNAPGEIRRLSEIGIPDIAVITNISKAHLEGLGDIKGVAMAKREILEHLNKEGTYVYNADDPWCIRIAEDFKGKKIGFGFNPQTQICCENVKKKDNGYVLFINKHLETYIPVPGYHNIYNCLASFAVCHALGHDIHHVTDAFSSFKLPSMRIEQERIGNITVINDAYNANPVSVRTALQCLSEMNSTGRKVFVCGDMLELGKESCQLHREIGETVAHGNIDLLWTVGKHASEIAKAAKLCGMPMNRIHSFMCTEDISPSEIKEFEENDMVLVKGSRGMHMERIIEKIRKFFSGKMAIQNCS